MGKTISDRMWNERRELLEVEYWKSATVAYRCLPKLCDMIEEVLDYHLKHKKEIEEMYKHEEEK
mgnify:CR=1 FL=1|tara:strand:- start:263 stop:454 length:192 start_codon:yes stop_codon:yes gene_type:complete